MSTAWLMFTCMLWMKKTSRSGSNILPARPWSSFATLNMRVMIIMFMFMIFVQTKLDKLVCVVVFTPLSPNDVNWIQEEMFTKSPDWRWVQCGEDGEVRVEVVHLPKPLHNLDELHHVTLALLGRKLLKTSIITITKIVMGIFYTLASGCCRMMVRVQ